MTVETSKVAGREEKEGLGRTTKVDADSEHCDQVLRKGMARIHVIDVKILRLTHPATSAMLVRRAKIFPCSCRLSRVEGILFWARRRAFDWP